MVDFWPPLREMAQGNRKRRSHVWADVCPLATVPAGPGPSLHSPCRKVCLRTWTQFCGGSWEESLSEDKADDQKGERVLPPTL